MNLKTPLVFLRPGKDRVLSHLGNAGRMLSSYAPSGPNKALAVVGGQAGFHVLKMKADEGTNIAIKATTSFSKDTDTLKSPPEGSTTYLEFILSDVSPTKFVEVLPGLKLQWDSPMMVALIIQNGKVTSTKSTLRTQLGDKGISLE